MGTPEARFQVPQTRTTVIAVYGNSCGSVVDPYATKATDSVLVGPAKPTIDLTATGPDATGKVSVQVDYDFPSRITSRHITMWVNGTQVGGNGIHPPNNDPGTWNVDLDFSCQPGTKTIDVYGTSCGQYPDQQFATKETVIVTVPTSKPDLTLIPNTSGTQLAVNYTFPNTKFASQRGIQLFVDGVSVVGPASPATVSGAFTADVSACWHTAKVVAVSCGLGGNPEFSNEVEIHNTVDEPTISVDLMKSTSPTLGEYVARITYDFGEAVPGRYARVERLAWVDADGTRHDSPALIWSLADVPNQPLSGQVTVYFNRPQGSGARQLIVGGVISACGTRTVERSIPCDCPATNDPVYFADGNMRLTDADPLPPVAGRSLVRTYDSDEQSVGLFGRGFSTLFEERVITNTFAGRDLVSIVSATNVVTTFERDGSAYRQQWPANDRTTGVLTYQAGTYTYRSAGSLEEHLFRASDGKLTVLRDRSTGYQASITYDNDLPQTITDSWTGLTWTLTMQNRRVTSISISDRPDLTWTYQYDGSGNLTSVVAPGNAVWRTYEYASNRMTASRDALGNLLESHAFDAAGYATSSTGPGDEIQTIEYNLPGDDPSERVTRVTMKTGATTRYIMRPSGGALRVVQIIGACATCGGGGDHTYVHDQRGRVTRHQGADGYISLRTYTGDRLASEQWHLKPADCDPATATNHCRLTTDALAAATLAPTSATITTSYEYGDPLWPDRITAVIEPSITAAGQARREETTYHPTTGEVLTRTVRGWSTATPPAAVTRTTQTTLYAAPDLAPAFDPDGNFENAWLALPQPSLLRKSIDGPRTDAQDVTSFVWYPVDVSVPSRLRGKLAATKNAAGHITRFEDYDVFGNVTRAVDPNGVATETTADGLGRPATSTLQDIPGCDTGTDALCATDLVTTRVYSPAAGPIQSERRPDGGATVYDYDSRGRIEAISRGPSPTDLRERIETGWDVATGQKSLERVLAFENTGWVEKKRETFAYDPLGRLRTTTHSDATFIEYTYDHAGRLSGLRDENHASANTTYGFDPAGRIGEVRQTLGAGLAATQYEYDVRGNLTNVTDPNGNVTHYTWDDFGSMLSQVSSVTGTTTYEYDAAGNLTKTTDANGAVTTHTYDALGRVLNAVSSKSPLAPETVSWSYDDAATGRFGIGRPAVMSDPAGSTSYFYERRGLLRREQRTFAGDSSTSTFTWDAGGNRTSIGYPSGTTVLYTVDYAGRPTSAASGGTPLASSAEYLPFGPLRSVDYGNGTRQTMQYDARYRMLENKLTAGTATLAEHDYTHDGVGNITAILAPDASYNRTFGYDDLNRLTTANTGAALWGTGGFTYDAMGNMLSSRIGDPAANVLAHEAYFTYAGTTPKVATVRRTPFNDPGQLSRIQTQAVNYETVTYDAAGNEMSYVATRSYSPRNLLQSVTDAADIVGSGVHGVDYQYDGRGVRLIRGETQAGGTVARRYYTYSPELQLLSITRDDGPNLALPDVKQEFVWFAGRPLVQLSPDFTDGPHWYFADHLGTPLLQTNLAGTIVWHAEYEPYGDIWKLRAPVPASEEYSAPPPEQPLRFPGQDVAMKWEGTEESYNIHRWYRAGWGRYTQADPLSLDPLPLSVTERSRAVSRSFVYAEDNPNKYIDPRGLCPCNRQCASGRWGYADRSASAGVLFGIARGQVTFFCQGSSRRCSYNYACTTVGLQGGFSGGFSVGMVGGCKCADNLPEPDGLTLGLFRNFGIQISNSPCEGLGLGWGRGWGAAPVVGSTCNATSPIVCKDTL